MIPCPRDGCDGKMHANGFSKRFVDQRCPECGRFRKFIIGDMPQYYCSKCLTFQYIETIVKTMSAINARP